jgi:hypothetical protein
MVGQRRHHHPSSAAAALAIMCLSLLGLARGKWTAGDTYARAWPPLLLGRGVDNRCQAPWAGAAMENAGQCAGTCGSLAPPPQFVCAVRGPALQTHHSYNPMTCCVHTHTGASTTTSQRATAAFAPSSGSWLRPRTSGSGSAGSRRTMRMSSAAQAPPAKKAEAGSSSGSGGGAYNMDDIVNVCKRRGFVFQSSEIYNGFNGFYDYGPLGGACLPAL